MRKTVSAISSAIEKIAFLNSSKRNRIVGHGRHVAGWQHVRRETSAKLLFVESPLAGVHRVHSGVDRLDADGTRVSGQESTNPPISCPLKNTPHWSAPLQWRSEIMSATGVARSDEHHHARDTA